MVDELNKRTSGQDLDDGELAPSVKWIRVNDHAKAAFESFWPIPDGITYNSYLIKGSNGQAVVDGSDERYAEEYLYRLKGVLGEFGRLRYIIVNHLEPDHESTLPALMEKAPNAKVVISKAGPKIAESFYDIPQDRLITLDDGQELDLGGVTLRFIFTPWLHWPETMMTYHVEEGILFTTDAFGSYGAVEGSIFDDQHNFGYYEMEAKRYYVNIICKYRKYVRKALEKISGMSIRMIAPSHGLVYRSHATDMLRGYASWSNPELRGVYIVYTSMYGHTPKIAGAIRSKLEGAGLPVKALDATAMHESYVLPELNESTIIVFMFPTYDGNIFMPMEALLYAMSVKEFGRGRWAAAVNTHGWAHSAKQAEELLRRAGFELLAPPLAVKPKLREKDVDELNALSDRIIDIYRGASSNQALKK